MDQRVQVGVASPLLPAQTGGTQDLGFSGASEIAAPYWLQQIDRATIVLINLALVSEVTIVQAELGIDSPDSRIDSERSQT